MKKVISIVLLLGISVNANAESFFDNAIFGISLINQNVDIEVSSSGSSVTGSDSGSGIGLYLDKYYKRKYRFNSTLSFINYDTFDISQLMFSADYLVPVNATVSFYGGGSLGGALQKYSDSSISDSALGLVYGVQLGSIIYINKKLMLELGYRFRPTSIETDITSIPGTVTTINDLSESYFNILLMF